MIRRLSAIATTVALAAVVAAAPARAATVDLRVEGAGEEAPIFAGAVATLPHAVDGGDGTGPHPCSGPAGAAPSATATGALDDALRAAGIPWRGNWDPSFRDFFVDRIGPHTSAAPDSYWSLTVNGQFAGGGCLTRVEDGDSVRFFYGPLFEAGAPGDPGAGAGTTGQSAGGGAGPGSPAAPPRRVRGVARRGAAYLRRNPDGAGAAWSRLALALRSGRETGAAAALLPPGRIERLAGGDFGGDVNATATAVLALADQRPRAARRAGRWLLSVQDPGGGFGFRPGLAPDVDTTGLASWALARLGLREPARRGCDFVRSAQNADGGFPALPGGASNAQSTGLGLVALRICGLGPRGRAAGGASPLDYLASLARPDGSIAYAGSAAPTPVWTTAQAMLGLTGREKLAGMDTLR